MNWIYSFVTQNYLKFLIEKDKDPAQSYWKAVEKFFIDNS